MFPFSILGVVGYNGHMTRTRVGVVRGGPSSEYVVSLRTGENVLNHLDREKYSPVDILISPRGDWFMDGVRTDLSNISHHVDVLWNALHGTFGEDGKAQQLFESFQIPYTGSAVLPSAVGMHKDLAKERFREAGLLVADGVVIEQDDVLDEVAAQVYYDRHLPLIVKPVSGGSSVATTVVRTLDELYAALQEASKHGDIMIEDHIVGKEATVCVVEGGEPGTHFVLFPIEIAPPEESDFFDYDSKYSGKAQEICPGRFPLMTHATLRDLAIKAHQSIGARHYSRSDFIIQPDGSIVILEINTLPGLTKESLFPKALEKGGVGLKDFLDHVIGLTMKGSRT